MLKGQACRKGGEASAVDTLLLILCPEKDVWVEAIGLLLGRVSLARISVMIEEAAPARSALDCC